MGKLPKPSREMFEEFIADCKDIFGQDLINIRLYGSSAEGSYRPDKSDINFLVSLSEQGIDGLDRALRKIGKWKSHRIAIPLFLTQGCIQNSLDVCPSEYLNFQRHYQLVYREDVLKDLSIDPAMLRLQ